ncbi:unnamed protein product [Sphagnum troendelagicum]|uniref:Uncharacterized protein n=1 Tax=Sphagnum troendelagicum TaxID=128251 RepID=A0ABP0UCY7_9BRYO
MAEVEEYRCFVGGLSRNTTDQGLEDAFRSFGNVIDAKVITDKETGQPRGFGFVNFGDERSMEDAIESLHGKDLDGRNITVNRAKPKGRDGGDRGYSGGGGRGRDGGGGGGGGDCFKCGQPGHWARECPGGGGGGGGGGGRSGSRYGDQGGSDRYGDRSGGSDRSRSSGGYGKEGRSENRDRDSGRNGAGGDRYGSGSGGGSSRYEGGSKDRSGPYDRPSGGSRSSHD